MDLLGSILGTMETLPSAPVDNETKQKIKEAKQKALKFKEEEKKRKQKFREEIEARINTFIQGPVDEHKMVFEIMDIVERSIAHDVAEVAGLTSYAFGDDDVDRHLIVWKKEHSPTEAELEAIRNGVTYDPEAAAKLAEAIQAEKKAQQATSKAHSNKRRSQTTEQGSYFEKYAKIVGEDSGLSAAATVKTNTIYGMVPSKNKEDKRSIEETMQQIRKRKQKNSSSDVT